MKNLSRTLERMRPTRPRIFLYALVAVFVALSTGTAFCEGWGILDGFYYGMAALTTVGFGDFVPVTFAGRTLAMVFVPVGIALGFGAGFVMLQDALRDLVNRERMSMVKESLGAHTIVCGYGKVGQVVVQTLRSLSTPVCVVESDPLKRDKLEAEGIDFVIGNAMESESLQLAGLRKASKVVTTFDNDAHNVYVVLEVRDHAPDVTIIASASGADAARRLKLAGAHRVISPAAIAGEMIAKTAINPDALDMLTSMTDVNSKEASFGQVVVQEGSWLAGRTLAEIGRLAPGALVVMVKANDRVQLAPGGSLQVKPEMLLIVVGRADALGKLSQMEEPTEGATSAEA